MREQKAEIARHAVSVTPKRQPVERGRALLETRCAWPLALKNAAAADDANCMRVCIAIAVAWLLSPLCLPAAAPASPARRSLPFADLEDGQAEAPEAGEADAEGEASDETAGAGDEGAEVELESEEQDLGPSASRTRPGRSGHGRTGHGRGAHGAAAVLSGLELTARARASLRGREPAASAIGFSFVLSAPSRMRATLAARTLGHGRAAWTNLPDSLSSRAPKGRSSESLGGRNRLAPGLYRLTVAPAGGRPHSIYLTVGRR
jgi:hypothetical protein